MSSRSATFPYRNSFYELCPTSKSPIQFCPITKQNFPPPKKLLQDKSKFAQFFVTLIAQWPQWLHEHFFFAVLTKQTLRNCNSLTRNQKRIKSKQLRRFCKVGARDLVSVSFGCVRSGRSSKNRIRKATIWRINRSHVTQSRSLSRREAVLFYRTRHRRRISFFLRRGMFSSLQRVSDLDSCDLSPDQSSIRDCWQSDLLLAKLVIRRFGVDEIRNFTRSGVTFCGPSRRTLHRHFIPAWREHVRNDEVRALFDR